MKNLPRFFTKEFLFVLEERAKDIDLISYIMKTKDISFSEAVHEICKYLKMKPIYFDPSEE